MTCNIFSKHPTKIKKYSNYYNERFMMPKVITQCFFRLQDESINSHYGFLQIQLREYDGISRQYSNLKFRILFIIISLFSYLETVVKLSEKIICKSELEMLTKTWTNQGVLSLLPCKTSLLKKSSGDPSVSRESNRSFLS